MQARKESSDHPMVFECLQGSDVITAKVSDHHPIIHDGVLFWNIMMQGKMRIGKEAISYNNGFGLIETDKQYKTRLAKVATVISEMVYQNPDLSVIGLCEGPIQSGHLLVFTQFLKKFPWMERFLTQGGFYQSNLAEYPNWGLLMLSDKKYRVSGINFDVVFEPSISTKLANRFQLWKLTENGYEKYFALGHFPMSGDELLTEKTMFSKLGNSYCELINDVMSRYAHSHFILCADFNFNPNLLKHWKDRVLDLIKNNNSILLTMNEKHHTQIKTATIDGILLSAKEKQKHYTLRPDSNLSSRLLSEYGEFYKAPPNCLIKYRSFAN